MHPVKPPKFSPTAMYAGMCEDWEGRRMPELTAHLLDTVGGGRLPLTLQSGEGALLWDVLGRTFWDFYGGHAVSFIGQGHPRWADALATQARQLGFFTTLADIPVRTRAAAALCAFTDMDVAWLVNSGAEANEAALKIARKVTRRPVVVAMEQGFHGRTMGALGVTWGYREQHAPPHGEVRFVPFGDLSALASAMDEQVAAVIAEPVQGIAGIVEPPDGWLAGVRELCDRHGALLVADEVQCGMGRMGHALAVHREGVNPDLVTVGKALGGGFPVAGLLLGRALADQVEPGEHGNTFGGGPMACAAVEATLAIIREEELLARARELGVHMRARLSVPGVREVRGAGAWIGLVLDRPAKPVAAALLERGYLVGGASDPHVLRLAPPAVMPHYAVDELAHTLAYLLQAEKES